MSPSASPNSKPITVLFLDHTAALSGGEIALLNLIQELDRKRFKPVVLLFSDGELRRKLEELGVEVRLMTLAESVVETRRDHLRRSALLRGRDVLRTVRFCTQLARTIRRIRPGVVHTNSLKSDLIGGAATRLARVPLIWHVRDRIAEDYLPPKVARIFRALCRIIPTHIVVNSDATLETLQLPPSLRGRATMVHDGCAVDRPVSDGPADPTQPVIGIVGRISPWKGQDVFLRAAKLVAEHCPEARFQVIGSAMFGEEAYEEKMRLLAAELEIADKVEWTGFRRDVPELMGRLTVVVHASTVPEPFGQVVIEAMAAGRPVVASDAGGVQEIVVHGESGLLALPGDAEAVSDCVVRLLRDPQLARSIGQGGRQRVERHFTIAQTARRMEAVFDKVLAK